LEGKLYRLSFWRVFYIVLCLIVIVGLGIVLPLYICSQNYLGGLVFTLFLWWLIMAPIYLNCLEAIAQHVVYSWCARRNIPRIEWISRREELLQQLPPRTRWFATYVDAPRKARAKQ
jgi:hypothetical protein